MLKELEIVSLFSGIGGFELGLKELGKVIWANEWDKFAGQTYQANFPHHNLLAKDIRKVKVEDIPSHDLLVGGFPCQTFSVAQTDKSKQGLNDPRGHLFKEILRIVEYHKPMWILLENVKGLTFKNNKETFDLILNSLKDLGYQVNWQILNAKDFGLPQNRERVFIVGNLLRIDFTFPQPTNELTKIGDILETKIDPKYYLSELAWAGMKKRKLDNLAKGSAFSYQLFSEIDSHSATLPARYCKDGKDILIFSYRRRNKEDNFRLYANELAPTLLSTMGTGGSNTPYVFQLRSRNEARRKGTELNISETFPALTPSLSQGFGNHPYIYESQLTPRRLTPRECLRLQGFSDDYQIVVSDSQLYKQAGNAVAVPVVKAISKKIKEHFLNYLNETRLYHFILPINHNNQQPLTIYQ